ncbi:MAG: RND family efflux transporter MFP subunit [Lentimonas sp.]|jgi:RND family efflux transporter MFP subunit
MPKHSLFTRSDWLLLVLLLVLAGCSPGSNAGREEASPPPVEVAEVVRGPISEIRSFSGSLLAGSSFIISSKLAGRLDAVLVDVGDGVDAGDVVAQIEPAEYQQALLQADADLMLEQANQVEAVSKLSLAERAMARAQALRQKAVLSEVEIDVVQGELLAQQAAVKVAQARVNRAQALRASAQIRLEDTAVKVLRAEDSNALVVAERFMDAGQSISANTPLLRIVDLEPLVAVFFVAEQDYASLHVGQFVQLTTDAYRGRSFEGRVVRIAPVFQESSRQARVEVSIPNADQLLKPGMFIRAEVELRRAEHAAIVPAQSLVKRSDVEGIFVIAADGVTAQWREVEVGIRRGTRVQIIAADLSGQVVTLGQLQIKDGMRVSITQATESLSSQ